MNLHYIKPEKEKTVIAPEYVILENNKTPEYLQKHINVGTKVVVTDGSYILDSKGEHPNYWEVFGRKSEIGSIVPYEKRRLFTVIDINNPRPTEVTSSGALSHWNNCVIEDSDGNIYYCSLVNIRRYE